MENIKEVEQLRTQSAATKKKIAKAMTGKKNPAYKSGQRSYREKVGLKANDGKIVHHKNGDRSDNRKSNLEVIPKSKRSEHEKIHHREDNFKKSGGRKPKSTTHKSHIRK